MKGAPPIWPKPAGREEEPVVKSAASMAMELEAEARALGLAMVKDLAALLSRASADAAAVAKLGMMDQAVRDMADKVSAEARSRAASLRQLAGIKDEPTGGEHA